MAVPNSLIAKLANHRENDAPKDMRAAFSADPARFANHSLFADNLLLDWSKCLVTKQTIELLIEAARAADLEARRDAMFAGEKINITEDRAVLHTALRNRSNKAVTVDGADVMPDVKDVLSRMSTFCEAVRDGSLPGSTGKPFTDIVNIGIGGSDLGPAMAVRALAPYHDGPRCHFVSNVDGADIADTLNALEADTTLFVVASKTFTTIETMTNAKTARSWLVEKLGEDAVNAQFCAVSTALDKVADFGIDDARVFGFWDWVGGRYSLWGAIGLPIMLAVGPNDFIRFLDGAHAVDSHFQEAPLSENIPVMLGLIGWWHRVICGHASRAIIPYDQRLARFPAYLQQLDMESNGKGVTIDGQQVAVTGPTVWGEPGTNGQHAFFQLLHQGTDVIPVEFLVAAHAHEDEAHKIHHELLLANCLAQSEALMKGRTLQEAKAQLLAKGMDEEKADDIAPHRVFSGNRPSVTIIYDKMDPYTLGRLIALYEHRVFVEAQLFGINAFDQWGVELGKELATGLLPVIQGVEPADTRDASTAGLVKHIHELRD